MAAYLSAKVWNVTAEFFLANVPEYHEGKTLEITLFDPGEGMQEIQILGPDGDTEDFDYWTVDSDVFGLTGSGLGQLWWDQWV